MRTAFKFFVAVLVFTLSVASFAPVNAQTIPKDGNYLVAPHRARVAERNTYNKRDLPAPNLEVGIRVTEVSKGVYNLRAYLDNYPDSRRPHYMVQWYKDGAIISRDWVIYGATYGHYMVLVQELTEGKWGFARVDLLPPIVHPDPSVRM